MTEYTEKDHAGNVYRRNAQTGDGELQLLSEELRRKVAERGNDPELSALADRLASIVAGRAGFDVQAMDADDDEAYVTDVSAEAPQRHR